LSSPHDAKRTGTWGGGVAFFFFREGPACEDITER